MAGNWVAEYEALHFENRELKSRLAAWEAWGDDVYYLWRDTPDWDMPDELGVLLAAKPERPK
jgi:hypothetical protein